MLTDRCLDLGLPVGEARVLFEVDDGVAVRDLRSRLALDAGYLSRTLRSLERRRLIHVGVHPDDARAGVAELTGAGREVVAEQDRRVGTVAASMMAGLDERRRSEFVGALTSAERLLRLAAVTLAVADPASAAAKRCLAGFATELKQRFPEGFDEADFVAAGEIRHVWVHAGARGLGVGRRLMGELERQAVDRGLHVVRLGTHRALTEAIAVYRTSGYVEIPRYDGDRTSRTRSRSASPARRCRSGSTPTDVRRAGWPTCFPATDAVASTGRSWPSGSARSHRPRPVRCCA